MIHEPGTAWTVADIVELTEEVANLGPVVIEGTR